MGCVEGLVFGSFCVNWVFDFFETWCFRAVHHYNSTRAGWRLAEDLERERGSK